MFCGFIFILFYFNAKCLSIDSREEGRNQTLISQSRASSLFSQKLNIACSNIYFFPPFFNQEPKVLTEINPCNLFLTSPCLATIDFYLCNRWQRKRLGGTMEQSPTCRVWSLSLLLKKSLKAYYETNRMKTFNDEHDYTCFTGE